MCGKFFFSIASSIIITEDFHSKIKCIVVTFYNYNTINTWSYYYRNCRISRDVGHTMSHSRGPKRTSKISTIAGGYTNASFARDEPEEAYDDGSKRTVQPEYATISEPDTNGSKINVEPEDVTISEPDTNCNTNDGSTAEIMEGNGKDNSKNI